MKKLILLSLLILFGCSKENEVEEELSEQIFVKILLTGTTCGNSYISYNGGEKTTVLYDVPYGDTITLYAEPTEAAPYVNGWAAYWHSSNTVVSGDITDFPSNQTEAQWKVVIRYDFDLQSFCSDTYYP